MSKAELNVLFKKIQKDDKKEVLEFHVQGDSLPHSEELVAMAGSIVVLNVTNSEAGKINVEFKSIQRDSKKTALKFNVKGDSDEAMNELYPFAGSHITLQLEPSQMSIDEIEQHEGVTYQVNKDGTAEISPDQMTLDDLPFEPDEPDPFTDDDDLLD